MVWLLALAVALVLNALKDSIVFFNTPTEVVEKQVKPGTRLRIGGLVKEEGKFVRILNLDQDVLIPKTDIEERLRQKVSIMPEGQEAHMSRREFVDLIAYLTTLK